MTEAERGRWLTYVRALADRMGLKDWTITVPSGPPVGQSDASTWMCYGRRVARIHLPDSFVHESPEEQRDTIVHELLHLHFNAMDGLVTDWLDGEKIKGYQRMFEHGIDAVAAALALHLPLPTTECPMGRQKAKAATTVPTPKTPKAPAPPTPKAPTPKTPAPKGTKPKGR